MSNYVEQLNPDAEAALTSIIGQANVGFYFPEAWVDTAKDGIITSSVSVPTGKDSFVIIGCDFYETENDFIDVSRIQISSATKPKDIPVTRDEKGASGWAFEHVSTILTWSPTVIEEVSIFEQDVRGPEDSVCADAALLFTYEKGKLLILAGGSFPHQLRLQFRAESINEALAELTVRKRLASNQKRSATT